MKIDAVETKRYVHVFEIPADAKDAQDAFNAGGPMRHIKSYKKDVSKIEIGRFMNITVIRKVN